MLKLENLHEMVIFLEKYNLLKLNLEESKILNKPIAMAKIEAVIKNTSSKQTKKKLGWMAL